MPRLLSDPDREGGQAHPILRVQTTIGRRNFNDIVINHRSVSGEHALITREGADLYLEDLNSTNGTFVNGRYIKRQRLQHNDTVEFGSCVLRYLADDGLATTADPAAPAASLQGKLATEAPATTTLPVGLGMQPAMVKVLTGEAAGRELVLTKAVTTMGKPGVLLASITRRSSGYVMAHVQGARRASINGTVMTNDVLPLHDGDVIDLAGTQMKFISG